MKISMHAMAAGSFVPMLESLSDSDKGSAQLAGNARDLDERLPGAGHVHAAQQVRLAMRPCQELPLRPDRPGAAGLADDEETIEDLKRRIARTVDRERRRRDRLRGRGGTGLQHPDPEQHGDRDGRP